MPFFRRPDYQSDATQFIDQLKAAKPTLEQEVTTEPEGLVIAFKNDSRVYFVHEYRVTQRIEGNEVRLEKEPVSSAKRVSTANAS